jgi:hypothetical protein
MLEGTTSRLIAADRLYGELYDFSSVSPEYFGLILVSKVSEQHIGTIFTGQELPLYAA